MCPLAVETVKVVIDEAEKTNRIPFGGYQTLEDLKWLLLLRLIDDISWSALEKHGLYLRRYTARPNGGEWDILGFEGKQTDDFPHVGLHGSHCKDVNIGNYKIGAYGLWDRAGDIYENEARTLKKVALGKTSSCDKDVLDSLVKRGFLIYKEDKYIPTIAVSHKNAMIDECVSKDTYKKIIMPIYKEMLALQEELLAYEKEVLKEDIPAKLKDQLVFCINNLEFEGRGAVIVYGVESGFLKIPENIEKSTIAMYICV